MSLLNRLLQNGPVTEQFSFTNRIRRNVRVPNVIAEIPGRELPGEVDDSWQRGTGAQEVGHSSLRMTRRYTHFSHEQRRATAERLAI